MDANLIEDGFQIVPSVLTAGECLELKREVESVTRDGESPGLRNLRRECRAVEELVTGSRMRVLVQPYFNQWPFPVRTLFFDKDEKANWCVPWHQDLSITVGERVEVQGFGPWSMKAGIHHVQPPIPILEGMVTLRLHLDDCDQANGALKVIPGSHRHGRLDPRAIVASKEAGPVTLCELGQGDVLVMRPLLLHASAKATKPSRRRVLHVEYAAEVLPSGLRWNEQARRCAMFEQSVAS